jgi:hypothetical protein
MKVESQKLNRKWGQAPLLNWFSLTLKLSMTFRAYEKPYVKQAMPAPKNLAFMNNQGW